MFFFSVMFTNGFETKTLNDKKKLKNKHKCFVPFVSTKFIGGIAISARLNRIETALYEFIYYIEFKYEFVSKSF